MEISTRIPASLPDIGIAYLQLPLKVDLQDLLADLDHCLNSEWRPHFNTRDYKGGWDSIALRSQDGRMTTLTAHPDSPYFDTPLLAECQHFKALLDDLQCELESARLLRQAAGGEIKTHRDQGLGYADGVFRIHIPLITNAEVEFVVAGARLPMQPGECWFADFSQPHSVANRGQTDRIHLVIDCISNAWTDAWLENAGFDMGSLVPPPMPEAQRQQMLLSLRSLDDTGEAVQALIVQLEAESAAHQAVQRLDCILDFLNEIGIPWRKGEVGEMTFLPGVEVVEGTIVMDQARLLYPGDLLHEAGHIAVLPPEKRSQFSGNVHEVLPEHKGDEVAVILWTYAAAIHLGLPLDYVIHDAGYRDDAQWLRSELQARNYIGLPLLVWMGLCEKDAFPKMGKWLRG